VDEHPALVPVHLVDPYSRAFSNANPGVEQEQDQRVVPAALQRCAVERAEQPGHVPLLEGEPDLLLLFGERNATEGVALDHVHAQAPGEEGSNLAVAAVLVAGRGSPSAVAVRVLVRETVREFGADQCPQLAAGISYSPVAVAAPRPRARGRT
jgi:hypothetical protein